MRRDRGPYRHRSSILQRQLMIDLCRTTLQNPRAECPFFPQPARPDVRRVIGRPASQHANVEGYAGPPPQSVMHGRRARWILSPMSDWMCIKRRSRVAVAESGRGGEIRQIEVFE